MYVATVAVNWTYLVAKTNSIENTFTPPVIEIKIGGEDIVGNDVQNNTEVPVYARVAIVAT